MWVPFNPSGVIMIPLLFFALQFIFFSQAQAQTCQISLSRPGYLRGTTTVGIAYDSASGWDYMSGDYGQGSTCETTEGVWLPYMEAIEGSPNKHTLSRVYFQLGGNSYVVTLDPEMTVVDFTKAVNMRGPNSPLVKALPPGTLFDNREVAITGFDFGTRAPGGIKNGPNPKNPKNLDCQYIESSGKNEGKSKGSIQTPCGQLYVKNVTCRDEIGMNFTESVGCISDALPSATDCFLKATVGNPKIGEKQGAVK